jgi:hypothetical protein
VGWNSELGVGSRTSCCSGDGDPSRTQGGALALFNGARFKLVKGCGDRRSDGGIDTRSIYSSGRRVTRRGCGSRGSKL